MELNFNETIILDGAMGTMLQKSNLCETPEIYSVTNGDIIESIHLQYVNAGAQIIYANTFGANSLKLASSVYSVNDVVTASIKRAKNAAQNKALVALDIGPIGELLAPKGTLEFEDAYSIFKEVIICGAKAGADVVVIETMTDLYEVKAAVLAAKENCELPIFVSMTFEPNRRTFLGTSVSEMAATLENMGISALGLNCSLGPKELMPIVIELLGATRLPVLLKPNAGLPDPESGIYDISPVEFSNLMEEMSNLGVCLLGGCCGTNPEYISEMSKRLAKKPVKKRDVIAASKVCTATKTVVFDRIVTVGERINPTGKPQFQQALKDGNMGYILEQAMTQVENGADLLDVNVGMPGIDEPAYLKKVVKELQRVTDVPLQIDSADPEAIEAALRIYNGKAIINSVTGERHKLDLILPIAKKYGAAVIGLTLDENGIPSTPKGRFEIAEKIIKEAESIGIPKENIVIDCLVLSVSSQQDEACVVLEAISLVKTLGVKTLLGTTNISFGLPNRPLIDRTFLLMGLMSGADIAIFNPEDALMTDTIDAFNLITGKDNNCANYIIRHREDKPAEKSAPEEMSLTLAVIKGLTEETKALTKQLLETMDILDIIDTKLIPALDIVGEKFESGELFLPQLLQSAAAAESGFAVLEEHMKKSGKKKVSKGKILLATVKGDIHDIGKNIVKTILSNYGYEIYDLGKDVEIEAVVNTAQENNIKFVGLSALMTTTLKSMQQTIIALRNSGHECKVCVGGAVLTAEYAERIGADYYAKDAKEAIDVAKHVFSKGF